VAISGCAEAAKSSERQLTESSELERRYQLEVVGEGFVLVEVVEDVDD